MATIKLNKMIIENFKGIKGFQLSTDGEDTIIKAENGVGKTTIYDAFLWLLFGKDSTGRKDFDLRPLDRNSNPIKELVVKVEAELSIAGMVHTFRKEHHEKVIKKELRGFEAKCWIDDVPKKVGEYNEYISGIISEDTFKLLTDLNFFNGKMHWSDRRKVLLDIAGEIENPAGFEDLFSALNGRTVDEYKKVLAEQKKRHVKERDETNPRIDEILRSLEHPTDIDVDERTKERESLQKQTENLRVQRQALFGKETQRNAKLDLVNNLKAKKIEREAQLKNDTSGIQSLLDEKKQIEANFADNQQEVTNAQNAFNLKTTELEGKQNELKSLMVSLENIRSEFASADTAKDSDTCYACGQKLPGNKLAENEKKRQAKITEIIERGDKLNQRVKEVKAAISSLEAELKELKLAQENARKRLLVAQESKTQRFAVIDEAIQANQTTPPEKDEQWQKIIAEIAVLEEQVGPPVSEQLNAIETQRIAKQNEIDKLNETLAQADRLEKDRTRVQELETKEKDLSEKIAEIDGTLDQIKQYNMAYSKLIESSVNDKFKYVTFKLFDIQLNGEIDDRVCEAMLNGVPYMDMSTGQQIIVGIDIINVLSEHYDLSVPLFVDHSESLTLPLEANSQTIKLYAAKGVKELQVEVVQVKKVVA